MLIYGASGHSKVIIDSLILNKIDEIFLFDDDMSKTKLLNYSISGLYNPNFRPNDSLIIGIGNNAIRKQISKNIKHKFAISIDIHSVASKESKIEDGTVLFSGSIVQSSTYIGKHCIINTKASVDHDCYLADFVHLGPGSTLCGDVIVGEGTLIGVGVAVIPGVKIGKWSIVAAGSVVIDNVPDFTLVAGNPARVIKSLNPQNV